MKPLIKKLLTRILHFFRHSQGPDAGRFLYHQNKQLAEHISRVTGVLVLPNRQSVILRGFFCLDLSCVSATTRLPGIRCKWYSNETKLGTVCPSPWKGASSCISPLQTLSNSHFSTAHGINLI